MFIERHHAIYFEGDRVAGIEAARTYITTVLGVPIEQNPDVRIEEYERVTVDIARTLKERAFQRPFGDAQAFVIGCDTILHEAQNALLKLLEEPAQGTHFIFIVPSRELLLPTVRSRMLYAGRVERAASVSETAEAFVRGTPAERQKIIAPIVKEKDRAAAQEFVRTIEQYLHGGDVRKNEHMLRDVAFVSRYMNDRSSSIKMLLEHLAAVL